MFAVVICGYVVTKWFDRIAANSSGGLTGCCLAIMYVVCFIVSVGTTTLLSAAVYDVEIPPERSTVTVISVTDCVPSEGSLDTLHTRMLSFPYRADDSDGIFDFVSILNL